MIVAETANHIVITLGTQGFPVVHALLETSALAAILLAVFAESRHITSGRRVRFGALSLPSMEAL